jgi:hypothetical protein
MADVAYSHTCEICGADDWAPVFTGPLRDGSFGSLTSKDHTIYECAGCAVQRLEESACKDDSFYSGKKYRELLGEASNAAGLLRCREFSGSYQGFAQNLSGD